MSDDAQKLTEATHMKQEDFVLEKPLSAAELRFLEEHDQAVIDWQREFSDATPEKQREMLGWDKKPTEKQDAAEWIIMTPLVRVLLEMPEQDALTLRLMLARARQSRKDNRPQLTIIPAIGTGTDPADLEMHIREILIYS